jgi:serine/threonine protein phosphatase PrpC
VGDSRAVMGKLVNGKWEARSLSRDHKVKKKKQKIIINKKINYKG